MVCSTLEVIGMPTVTVKLGTTGFAYPQTGKCDVMVGGTLCKVYLSEVLGKEVTVICTIISSAAASLRATATYIKDGTTKSAVSPYFTVSAGETPICISTGETYTQGKYSGLVVTITDIVGV